VIWTFDRAEFIELLREKGIGTSVHFIPVPMHPFYKKLGYSIEDYPNAFEAYNGAVSLPLYPKMTDEQVDRVIEVVLEIANTSKK
jgi:dTDP-4-amino-4,6-dideoxygalactose transaminase